MDKPVPRSRLNIKYRTKIEGAPKDVKLPMRFLVLGDFTGDSETKLDDRKVHSILPGMQLASFMQELGVTAPIEQPELKQTLTGKLSGQITARYKSTPKASQPAVLQVTGECDVSGECSENGLRDFTGKVTIRGEIATSIVDNKRVLPHKVELLVTGKVRGDLAKGGITGTVSGSHEIKLTPRELPATDSTEVIKLAVAQDATVAVDLTIPLFDLKHFRPEHIAASVPEIRRRVILRRILLELRGYISGQPDLREKLKELLTNNKPTLKKLQEYLKEQYHQLAIAPKASTPAEGEKKAEPGAAAAEAQKKKTAADAAAAEAGQKKIAADAAAAEAKNKKTDAAAAAATAAEEEKKKAEAAATTAEEERKKAEAAATTAEEQKKKAEAAATTAEEQKKKAEAAAATEAEKKGAAGTSTDTDSVTLASVLATIDTLLTASGLKAKEWDKGVLVSSSDSSSKQASQQLEQEPSPAQPPSPDPSEPAKLKPPAKVASLVFRDHEDKFPTADRFINALTVLLANVDLKDINDIRGVMKVINDLSDKLDVGIQEQIRKVLYYPRFQALEANWLSLRDICAQVKADSEFEIIIDFLDVSKTTLGQDLEDHSAYILNSALFRKIYVEEYDRYGGKPFGAMIGLYSFDSSPDKDIEWLDTMSHVAAAAHCPFIAGADPTFFKVKTWAELERKDDLETLLNLPQFARWNNLRASDHAAYIGLTLPRFLLRTPYDSETAKSKFINFEEKITDPSQYLWGNAAVLFARNMVKAFGESGWCQSIVGPLGGGIQRGLPVHMVPHHGQLELQPPVEIAIPDYRELQFANTGFMALIHCKGSADSTFFSARSIKKPIEFDADIDTKNADLVCNLAYTLSITRLAHYVKRMVRDYIGSTADAPYIQTKLEAWLVDYVTTAVNPDDLTLRHYPFKAMSVSVTPKPGPFGWYSCTVSVLPHIQFQGMDVELRLEAALGGA